MQVKGNNLVNEESKRGMVTLPVNDLRGITYLIQDLSKSNYLVSEGFNLS